MEVKQKNRHVHKDLLSESSIIAGVLFAFIVVCSAIFFSISSSYATDEVSSSNKNYGFEDEITIGEVSTTAITSDSGFTVNSYFTTGENKEQVYSTQYNKAVAKDTKYTKGKETEDLGLLFILEHSQYAVDLWKEQGIEEDEITMEMLCSFWGNISFEGEIGNGNNQETTPQQEKQDAMENEMYIYCGSKNKDMQTWITQVAIWLYLYEKEDLANDGIDNDNVATDSPNYIPKADLDKIKAAKGVTINGDTTKYFTLNKDTKGEGTEIIEEDPSIYENIMNPINYVLKHPDDLEESTTVEVEKVTETAETKITNDGEYYITPEMKVNGDNFFGYYNDKFTVELVEAPKDTEYKESTIVNEWDEQETVFYFKIPAKNLTEENKTLKYNLITSFSLFKGYDYSTTNGPSIISTKAIEDYEVTTAKELTVNPTVSVPDTGMTTSKLIALLGTLLFTAGIVIICYNSTKQLPEN